MLLTVPESRIKTILALRPPIFLCLHVFPFKCEQVIKLRKPGHLWFVRFLIFQCGHKYEWLQKKVVPDAASYYIQPACHASNGVCMCGSRAILCHI